MDKEKLITIFIGLIVGVTLASGYFLSSRFLPQLLNRTTTQTAITPSPKVLSNNEAAFSLTEPENFFATADPSILIKGKAPAGTKIIIFTNSYHQLITTTDTGDFEVTVKLEEGDNEVTATTISPDGKIASLKRIIVREVAK